MVNSNKYQVLFYAPILSYPPATGPEISVINAIRTLSANCDLHIVTSVHPSQIDSPIAREFFRKYCFSINHSPAALFWSQTEQINKWLRRTRRLLSPFFGLPESLYLLYYKNALSIDVFWIDRVLEHSFSVFRCLRLLLPNAIIVADTEAIHSRFVLRELPLISNWLRYAYTFFYGKMVARNECRLIKMADVITVVSDIDGEFFKSRRVKKHRAKVMRFSNVIDINAYEDYKKSPQSDYMSPIVLLVGQFGHLNSPMDRAARWLAEDIMPVVWNSIPEAHLYIIGRNSQITQAKLSCERITVFGQVPSVLPYLKQAALTVVPLKFESGTRFKIVESGAAFVACVSTTLGAEGLDVKHGENILIADEAESFAAAMVSVLSSKELQRMLGSNLNELVRRNYSLEKQTKEGEIILEHLKNKSEV